MIIENLKTRFAIIGVLVLISVWALWPRDFIVGQIQNADGTTRDSVERRWNIKQGLDLQGGIHLALELDESRGPVANRADAIDRALTVIRSRIDEFGVQEPLVQKQGNDRIVVELAGIRDPQRAKQIVQRSAFLEFQITDKDRLFDAALPGIDRALLAAGVSEATIGRQVAGDTGAAAAPAAPSSAVEDLLGGPATPQTGATDTTRRDTAQADTTLLGTQGVLSSLLLRGSMPGEWLVPEEKERIVRAMLSHPAAQRLIPRGIVLRWALETVGSGSRTFRALYALQERPLITGEYLTDAQARLDPIYNQAVVDFQLSRRGGRIFERETGRHVQDHMAIVLDGRVQSQPPVIRSVIGSRGQIELGSASLQEAQDLALVLKAGSLPAPLRIVEERTVGPSLGEDSIRKSVVAGIVGVVLVVGIMLSIYRLAGVMAVTALALYCVFTLGGLAAFNATLTLPGVAGFVLSVGMAVDANILIFERIREELLHGKSVRLAVDAGYKMAMNAIVDSNVSTMLTAAFLFQFGTGPVRGFAVTLILGILASMICAIFVTRTFFLAYLARRQQLQALSI